MISQLQQDGYKCRDDSSELQSRYRTGSVIICFYSSSSKGWGRMPDSLAGKEGGGEQSQQIER